MSKLLNGTEGDTPTLTGHYRLRDCSYIVEMKPQAILRRNSQDDTESNTQEQSDDGRIIVPAKIAGDDYPCPDSDGNENCGYHWKDYTGDDDIVSPARNILRKLGRHSRGKVCSVI